MAPYCDELHEEGLDKEDTVTEPAAEVEAAPAPPVAPVMEASRPAWMLLLLVVAAVLAPVTDVKGPGALA